MSKTASITRIVRRVSTILLLLTVVLQLTTVVIMEAGLDFEIMELHEALGLTFFALILVHIVIFRKSLMNMAFPKAK